MIIVHVCIITTRYLQVDFEESKVVGRFVVKPNVDAELDDSEWQSFVSSHQEFGIKFNNG